MPPIARHRLAEVEAMQKDLGLQHEYDGGGANTMFASGGKGFSQLGVDATPLGCALPNEV